MVPPPGKNCAQQARAGGILLGNFYFLPHPVHSFCQNSESEVILALEKYHKNKVNHN